MTQIKDNKRQAISGKKDYSQFTSSFNTTARAEKYQKTKGEILVKMCQLIFLKIYPTITETMTYKSSMYLLGMFRMKVEPKLMKDFFIK